VVFEITQGQKGPKPATSRSSETHPRAWAALIGISPPAGPRVAGVGRSSRCAMLLLPGRGGLVVVAVGLTRRMIVRNPVRHPRRSPRAVGRFPGRNGPCYGGR
jgi:hypothetical protein